MEWKYKVGDQVRDAREFDGYYGDEILIVDALVEFGEEPHYDLSHVNQEKKERHGSLGYFAEYEIELVNPEKDLRSLSQYYEDVVQENNAYKKDAEPTEGLRFNDGKPRFDLLPPEAIIALADHFRKGSEKYAERNWEKSGPWCSKTFASMERHAWAWMNGEDYDQENGSHHMIAVAWNALALYTYHMRGVGVDDRPKIPKHD